MASRATHLRKRDGPEQNLVVPGHRARAVSNTAANRQVQFVWTLNNRRIYKTTKNLKLDVPKGSKTINM